MNLAQYPLLSRTPEAGTWYRAVRQHHFATALAYQHSVTSASRFNPGTPRRPRFPVLYLSETPQTCLFEVGAMLGSPATGGPVVPNPAAGPWAVFPVTVKLRRVVDLCDAAQLELLGTSVQEMTGDWWGYAARAVGGQPQTAPTQLLGSVLFARAKVEGLLAYSARDPVRRNLVVFPTRLRAGRAIDLLDPSTGRGHRHGPGGSLTPAP